jgi:hypothetical protein
MTWVVWCALALWLGWVLAEHGHVVEVVPEPHARRRVVLRHLAQAAGLLGRALHLKSKFESGSSRSRFIKRWNAETQKRWRAETLDAETLTCWNAETLKRWNDGTKPMAVKPGSTFAQTKKPVASTPGW